MVVRVLMVLLAFYIRGGGSQSECCTCIYEAVDCQDYLTMGNSTSGVFRITPLGMWSGYDVYCDMETDGGGWLIFQRRVDGSVDFYRGWDAYERGFGNVAHEHWLGLLPLKRILSQGHYELRIDLEDWEGDKVFAQYGNFDIGNSRDLYSLTVSMYSGTAGDSLYTQNGQNFSTMDFDNDSFRGNCAEKFLGAWWYKNCKRANLNGFYFKTNPTLIDDGVHWYDWKGLYYSLKKTEMKIRRVWNK